MGETCRYLLMKPVYVPAIYQSVDVPVCKLGFKNRVSSACHCGRFKPRPEVEKPDKFEAANLIAGASRMRGKLKDGEKQ